MGFAHTSGYHFESWSLPTVARVLPPRLLSPRRFRAANIPLHPCSFCRRPLPGTPSLPERCRPNTDHMCALSDRQGPTSRPPFDDPLTAAARHRAPQPHATGTKPAKVAALLAFAAARLEVPSALAYASPRTLHRADSPSFERVVRTLLCFTSPFPMPPSSPPAGPCGSLPDASRRDFQRSPLRRSQSKSPLPRRHCCLRFGSDGATVQPCSASAVSHRPDGFRLSNLARLLRRAANHGVRGVLPACEAGASPRGPALRSVLPGLSCPASLSRSRADERHQPKLYTVHLSLSSFPAGRRSISAASSKRRGSQGFPPRPGSLRYPPFPEDTARYFPGLAARPS